MNNIMARCNAWHGEPDPAYRCDKPKGHKGKHFMKDGDLEVRWSKDDRSHAVAFKLYFESACYGYADKFSLKRRQQMIDTANRLEPKRDKPYNMEE